MTEKELPQNGAGTSKSLTATISHIPYCRHKLIFPLHSLLNISTATINTDDVTNVSNSFPSISATIPFRFFCPPAYIRFFRI